MSQPVDLIRTMYDNFAAGDVPAVIAAMSPDIEWNEADDFIYADGNPYRSPEAVLNGVFARCDGEWDGFGVVVEELLDAGDTPRGHTIVALGHYVGTFKATGTPQHTQMAHVWRIRDGKAVAFQQHANTLHVARVTGTA